MIIRRSYEQYRQQIGVFTYTFPEDQNIQVVIIKAISETKPTEKTRITLSLNQKDPEEKIRQGSWYHRVPHALAQTARQPTD